jgi:hypothetical protein
VTVAADLSDRYRADLREENLQAFVEDRLARMDLIGAISSGEAAAHIAR